MITFRWRALIRVYPSYEQQKVIFSLDCLNYVFQIEAHLKYYLIYRNQTGEASKLNSKVTLMDNPFRVWLDKW